MITVYRLLILSCVSVILSSCGFSLRGSDVLSSKFQVIQLDMEQPNSEFSRLLRRSLEVADVSIEAVALTNSDSPVLLVSNERIVSRPITVNPRARAAQYEMRLSINIALGNAERYLISPETLMVERIYFEDIANIAGTQEEVEIITAEMRRELVNQLMRRLEAVET
ncbi:MAG: LPS assembly lipoprotein LptE [Pseudomonadales bacterium]|jgi:LPS-assembly lipoprotein|nr:LPS assembly lipoprotein LptE [Pseudomonadales bacterium]